MYLGPLVLKSILSPDIYVHFLTLHVAITILSTKTFSDHIDYAESLLKNFVQVFKNLYGEEYISHNVHNLLHLCNDVRRFGPLDMFSAFPFEKHMQNLKRMVRKGNKPVQQIVKRIHEHNYVSTSREIIFAQHPKLHIEHSNGPFLPNMIPLKQFKKIEVSNFVLSITEPDNCCCLSNNIIIIVRNETVTIGNSITILGQTFLNKKQLYSSACDSCVLGIYICSNLEPLHSWPMNAVCYKCVKLNTSGSEQVVLPLLHLE